APNEIRGIRQDALNALKNYAWPGNIRELENVIERSFVLENSLYLTMGSLPENLQPLSLRDKQAQGSGDGPSSGAASTAAIDFHAQKEQFERDFIVGAL